MKKFAVLGSGISYTKSPFIHGEIYRALGVRADYAVEDIAADSLDANVGRLFSEYDGFNVTQPFKKEILKYVASGRAAVNTVVSKTKTGYNTDGDGFMTDLIDFAGNVRGMDILILGAGGAAVIVAEELAAAGAKLTIYNRTKETADALAKKVGGLSEILSPPEMIINCTSVGWDRVSNPLPTGIPIGNLKYAYDLIYPPWVSPFLANARLVGAKTRNGWGMLVHQAIKADEIFLERKLDGKFLADIILKKIILSGD